MITKQMRLENAFDGWFSRELNKLVIVKTLDEFISASRKVYIPLLEMQAVYGHSLIVNEYERIYTLISQQVLDGLYKLPIREL